MSRKKVSRSVFEDALRREDRILWEAVQRTVQVKRPSTNGQWQQPALNKNATPLTNNHTSEPVFAKLARKSAHGKSINRNAVHSLITRPSPQPNSTLQKFDKITHKKIAKGRVAIDGRVDLHGLTRDQAYDLLLRFIFDAQRNGARFVLVITGKGRSQGSDGILKQSVPHWLATPPFRFCVSGFEDAGISHGGAGALYVRIKRQTGEITA